ncbi:MAG TPA: tetratricopeptide repeat protein, partial [Vicinamibacteria bacterium]|nr:tetratricopeptide repeat protein [Vicinamibacteria bacterium]
MLLATLLSSALLLPQAPPPDAAARRQAEAHVRDARRLMASEAFAEAAEEYRKAIKLNRYFTVAYYGLGQAHMALKEYPGAAKAFEQAKSVFHEVAGDAALRQLESDKVRDDRIRDLRDAITELNSRQVAANSP